MQRNPFAPPRIKSANVAIPSVAALDIATFDIDISSDPSEWEVVTGYAIQSTGELVPMQMYVVGSTSIHVRVKNVYNGTIAGANISVFYI